MPVSGLWYLEDLAADGAAGSVCEFMFTSGPLTVEGGAGSPPHALAIT